MNTNYLIVGQGIAGTLLAWMLKKKGQDVVVVDAPHLKSSSSVAAGIINPVTGRSHVKSWLIEELIPVAKKTYRKLEKELNISIYDEKPIVRAFHNVQQQNDWMARMGWEGYEKYMLPDADFSEFQDKIKPTHAYAQVRNSAQVHMQKLVETYRTVLKNESHFLEEFFDYEQLVLKKESVVYKNIQAEKVIFCEGFAATQNPFFNYLPFKGYKGQILKVRIPNAHFSSMLKQGLFIVPLEADLYWVGAKNDKVFTDDFTTDEGKSYLEKGLKELLNIPFTIEAHEAAIRPTVRDRRPYLGLHPTHPQLVIFNGMGTKGASLAPYFGQMLVDFLVEGIQIDKVVDVIRCNKSL